MQALRFFVDAHGQLTEMEGYLAVFAAALGSWTAPAGAVELRRFTLFTDAVLVLIGRLQPVAAIVTLTQFGPARGLVAGVRLAAPRGAPGSLGPDVERFRARGSAAVRTQALWKRNEPPGFMEASRAPDGGGWKDPLQDRAVAAAALECVVVADEMMLRIPGLLRVVERERGPVRRDGEGVLWSLFAAGACGCADPCSTLAALGVVLCRLRELIARPRAQGKKAGVGAGTASVRKRPRCGSSSESSDGGAPQLACKEVLGTREKELVRNHAWYSSSDSL